MKHIFHRLSLVLALLTTVPALAQTSLHKVKAVSHATTRTASEVTLTQCVAAVYSVGEDGLGDYYLIFSEKGNATFDMSAGTLTTADDNTLTLDLYAEASSPIVLPEGVYSPGEEGAMTYYPDYSTSIYYDESGNEKSSQLLTGGVNVVKNDDGTYSVTATDAAGTTYSYTGNISFTDPSASTYVYPQIGADVNVTFTGGLAYYYGNLYESKTGNMYINLYSGEYDSESGGMTSTGYDLAICAFSSLFGDPANAKVLPGTYTVGRSFQKNTYYPGMEIDYIGMTIVFGTYIKQRKAMTGGDSDYAYSYIVDGTVVITEGSSDRRYNVTVDLLTDDGHTVKGTATNVEFSVTDLSDDSGVSVDSNLDHDVELDLDYIKTARSYYLGEQNGVKIFTVDLGSPSGKDGDEGDLIRMEFQADVNSTDLPAGTYEVMENNHLWTNQYAPFQLTQNYFTDQGERTGTRYMHFAKGRYCVADTFAAVVAGRVSVEKVEGTDNYHFTINLQDGNAFDITGDWTGPMERNYDLSAISQATLTNGKVGFTTNADGSLTVNGVESSESVSVFTADGRLVSRGTGARVDLGQLPQGIYLIKTHKQGTIKYVKQ